MSGRSRRERVAVAVARNAPCPCGSGLKYKKCHGQTRSEQWATRRRLEALAEVHDLGALFPFLRPQSAEALAFADRIADSLAEDDSVTTELGEEGLELVDESERRRLVTSYGPPIPAPGRRSATT